MKPSDFYQNLLAKITKDEERRVFEALSRRLGQTILRSQLILEVFGQAVPAKELASNAWDRRIRKSIERLRAQDFPIISTSGGAGYTLKDDPQAIDAYIAEEQSRISKIQEKIGHLRRSKDQARMLHHWRETNETIVQARMF